MGDVGMSRRTVAAGLVLAGGLAVAAAAVAALFLAALVVTPAWGWVLYGTLAGGLLLILVGGLCIDVDPRPARDGR